MLVTGASGFIGGAIARRLAKAGADVHGTGLSRRAPPEVTHHTARLPEDASALIQEIQPVLLLHLACPISMSSDSGARTALKPGIVDATEAVAQAAAQAQVPLIHVSSCAVYEGAEAPFREGQALHPTSPYADLKRQAESKVLTMANQGLRFSIVRPFRTYGPGCTSGLVAEACQAAVSGERLALTDGQQVREWNHVDSICDGILSISQRDPAGEIWNVGGGDRLSVLALAQRIFTLAGRSLDGIEAGARPRRPGEVARFWGDHRHADTRWGPLAHQTLEAGLMQTLQWHRGRLAS